MNYMSPILNENLLDSYIPTDKEIFEAFEKLEIYAWNAYMSKSWAKADRADLYERVGDLKSYAKHIMEAQV